MAAALFWRSHLGGEPAPAEPKARDGRSAKAQQTKARNRDALKAFVEQREAVALAALVWHEYCEMRGRQREALALAEAAHKRDPKSLLFEQAVPRCWERDGWDEQAFALRKQRYWRSPRLDEYAP